MSFVCLTPLLLAAGPPAFVLYSTREDLPNGPLARLAPDGAVQVGTNPPVVGGDLVALRRAGAAPPHFPHDRPHLRFANGDRLPGRLIAIAGEKVRFVADLGTPQELVVPLSTLAAVWLTGAAASRADTEGGRRTLADKRRQDVAVLSNGDTARGTVVGWAEGGPLRMEVEGKVTDVPADRVQALLLNTELARGTKPRTAYWQLVLANGARLSVRTAELAGDELRATTLTGAGVRIPVTALAAVNVYGGPAVYLSDLSPRRYEQTPYFGAGWPVANDRSVAGGDLRLGGGTYDKGLGLHSQSRVTYAVPAGARRFEAVVGLDEVAGRSGTVRIAVLGDGQPLIGPADVTASDPPRQLRVALPPAARELMLVVEFGRGGDVQDHVDWADARIIVGGSMK